MRHIHNSVDFFTRCSFCGKEISQDKMLLLDEREQRTVLHATCEQCNTATLVFISNNQTGIVGMGIATDMDHAEVAGKFGESAVNADEVIAVHRRLYDKKESFADFIKNA